MNTDTAIAKKLEELLVRDGVLTPSAVVIEAKQPNSPLHSAFDWDDSAAAEKWRLHQARQLINSVKVTITQGESFIVYPKYVRDDDTKHNEQGYQAIDVYQVSDEDKKRSVLQREFRSVIDSLKRAQEIADAFGMKEDLQTLLFDTLQVQKKVDAA